MAAPWQSDSGKAISSVRMRFDMMLGGLAGMMVGLEAMAMRNMGMMTGEMMLALFVMLGGFAMMLGGLFVMVGGGLMVIGFVQSAHFRSPLFMRLAPRTESAGPRCRRGDAHVTNTRNFVNTFNFCQQFQ